jgi:hypothetical protein
MPTTFTWTLVPSSGASSISSAASSSGAVLSGAGSWRDLGLAEDGDLSLIDGDLVMLTGAAGVASDIKSRAQAFAGEWRLDETLGLPFFDIFGQKFNQGRMESIFRDMLRGTPAVNSVLKLAATFASEGRRLDVAFSVDTDFGQLDGVLASTGGA